MREVGGPAREAHENRFNSLSESAENSYWLRGSRGISVRVRRENRQSKKTQACYKHVVLSGADYLIGSWYCTWTRQ